MKRLLLLIICLSGFGFAYTPSSFDSLLRTYVVDSGFVDYDAWAANPDDVAKLQSFVGEMAAHDPSGLSGTEQLAFWINAYNAFALHEVLNRYPTESIRPTFIGIPERSFFIDEVHVVNGETYSLDGIENDILRTLNEPRIHFAINCASASCPVLRKEIYSSSVLDKQLTEQAVAFVNDPSRNSFDPATNQANISKIFDWFEGDFDAAGGVAAYLSQFAEGDAKTVLDSGEVSIDYLTYDWALNEAQ